MTTYTPTIGIEVHAELKTKSKMFCGCANDPHGSEPNAHICPVCMAHPGTLPTVNRKAVEHVLMVGTALGGSIATYSEFDRKNYFYPDIPKAYQISQYAYPFVSGGELAGVSITRVHLEEDTARSQHDQGDGSLVDFNRAGVPLMELVTEPVIHDAQTAGRFARELQLLLRTLGVSDANMERGEMRVEANISVSPDEQLRTKVEVKNLNSFRSMEAAIAYEIDRQIHIYENGGTVNPETRGWDEQKGQTYGQRTKETADDYRYFPDPDIPKFELTKVPEFNNSRLNEKLPELPTKTRDFLQSLEITADRIELLLAEPAMLQFFRATATQLDGDADRVRIAVNYLTSDVSGIMQREPTRILTQEGVVPFTTLVGMVADNKVTSRVAKDLLTEVVFDGKDPQSLAEERGLSKESSNEALLPMVEQIIAENPTVVADYKAGKENALQFLIGQAMKMTRGAADPATIKELFTKNLSE